MGSTSSAFQVSRRTVIKVSALAMASTFLAACTTPPAPAKLKGRVVISTAFPIPENAQTALTDAYRAVQPDVEVLWELPGSDNYVPWLQTQLAAGNIRPDIVTGFAPYDDYIDFQAWEQRQNPHTGNEWDEDLTFKGLFDASGKLNFIGTRAVTVPIIYNIDQFKAAGISTPPATWDELVEACEKLSAAGFTPFAANFPLTVSQWMREVYFDQYHTDWVETVRAQEGDWNYNPEKDGVFTFDPQDPDIHDKYTFNQQRYYAGIRDGVLRFDTPEVTEFIANMARVFPQYAQADFALGENPYPRFLARTGSMLANTPGALVSLPKDMDKAGDEFEFGTFPFPNMTGPLIQTTETRAVESISGDYISVIDKGTDQSEVVMDFLMFWLSKAGYGTYLEGAASDSTWSGPDGPLLIEGVEDPAPYTGAFDDLPSRGNAEASYNALFLNWGSGIGNFRAESQQIYLEALQGSRAPEEASAALQDYVTANLDGILEASQLTQADLDTPARQPGS